MKHIIAAHNSDKWFAVPANNGGCGPAWQWGNEILIGFTAGDARFDQPGHQVRNDSPHLSNLARSENGGETWQVSRPVCYPGQPGCRPENASDLPRALDFGVPGFVMRIEGNGYHGNQAQQWFYSYNKGHTWFGPYHFASLFTHPQLAGKEFTGRTAYLINGAHDCFLFLSVRENNTGSHAISLSDKVFLARTTDGGRSFQFVSWIVQPEDPFRAVMPAPVRLSAAELITAIRRRGPDDCWIDCYASTDNGINWIFRSRICDTGDRSTNGNPPALIFLKDGRLCCVTGQRDRRVMLALYSADDGRTWPGEQIIRDDFQSHNGYADLGYARLFQRLDGKLTAVYFWCSHQRPETHIASTIFDPPVRRI